MLWGNLALKLGKERGFPQDYERLLFQTWKDTNRIRIPRTGSAEAQKWTSSCGPKEQGETREGGVCGCGNVSQSSACQFLTFSVKCSFSAKCKTFVDSHL